MTEIIVIVLFVITVMALAKWFRYYCVCRALLFYIAKEYKEALSAEKIRKLTAEAKQRILRDFKCLKNDR